MAVPRIRQTTMTQARTFVVLSLSELGIGQLNSKLGPTVQLVPLGT